MSSEKKAVKVSVSCVEKFVSARENNSVKLVWTIPLISVMPVIITRVSGIWWLRLTYAACIRILLMHNNFGHKIRGTNPWATLIGVLEKLSWT
jgi:hypothetical protein